MVNTFVTDRGEARGEFQIGLHWHKAAKKFQSECSNPLTGEREYLGLFTTEQQAHQAWRKRKNELAHELADIQTDHRVAEALRKRYSTPRETII